MAANPEVVEYIRRAAIARGIDPEVALRVAGAEALNVFDPNQPDRGGDEGSSFGPYQFHYAGISKSMPNAGMGDDFTKATGLRASDPSTWKRQVDFALDYAAKKGWTPWMGAQAAGIGDFEGIQNASASATQNNAAVNVPSAAFPYKLYGGATREDAITGMNRQFSDALIQLYNNAPPEVQKELGLNSAYRNAAIQQQLWDKSDKTGRRVAAPGKSRHQHGEAADLYGFGLTKDQVSQTTRDWVTQNATKYGLGFPVQGEPWHIQLMRAQGQAGPGARPASPAAPAIADPHGAVVAETLADKPKKKSAGLAKALMDNPFEMSGGGYQTNLVAPAAPAALAQAGPTSMVNPQQVEQRRAALAAIMQRLNSGSLA
jgi:D-alanyl-D-alanine carboxypeptidase